MRYVRDPPFPLTTWTTNGKLLKPAEAPFAVCGIYRNCTRVLVGHRGLQAGIWDLNKLGVETPVIWHLLSSQ